MVIGRARNDLKPHIGDVDAAAVPCGFGRAIGNKVNDCQAIFTFLVSEGTCYHLFDVCITTSHPLGSPFCIKKFYL